MDTESMNNKFKFITIAAARCHQLQRGSLPRIEVRSRKAVTIAQEEVRRGLIHYRVPEDLAGTAVAAVDPIPEAEDAG